MIRIIGGAARTGKSLLSRRLLLEIHQPYLSLDVVKMGLANGVPEVGVDPEASSSEMAEKLWPMVRAMCVNMIETGITYIVEGEVLPAHADELAQCYPGEIRACFLGYADITPEQKQHEIREFGGHPNDWTADCSDDYLFDFVRDSIAFSRTLRDDCADRNIPYFDTSFAFLETLDRAAEYLRGE
jgi:hypothetical protein